MPLQGIQGCCGGGPSPLGWAQESRTVGPDIVPVYPTLDGAAADAKVWRAEKRKALYGDDGGVGLIEAGMSASETSRRSMACGW